MGDAGVVPAGFDSVVIHEVGPSFGEDTRIAHLLCGGAQVVCPVLGGDGSQFLDGQFVAGGQGVVALGEADGDGLLSRVGQHEVEEQVGEGLAIDADLHLVHHGVVRLALSSGLQDLREDDLSVIRSL